MKADMTAALMLLNDYDGPYDMYRYIYKYTDCGPGVGFQIDGNWMYCDDLRKFGAWEDFKGHTIQAMSISSIVEGVEQCTDNIILEAKDLRGKGKKPTRKTVGDAIFKAVAKVDAQANDIWDETHGCEKCAEAAKMDFETNMGEIPVNPKCPECNGCGTII